MAVSGRLAETKTRTADTYQRMFCEPCLDNEKHIKAHGLCEQCNEAMCRVCFKHHLAARVCRNHVFLETASDSTPNEDFEDDDRNIETCGKHGNETIKFYCRSHNVVGCAECMLMEGHNNCKYEYIKDLCTNYQNSREFKHINERIASLEGQNDGVKSYIQQNTTRNNEMKENAIVNINRYFNAAVCELEKKKKTLRSEVSRRSKQNEVQFDRLQNVSESIDADILSIKQNVDPNTFQGSSLFIKAVNSVKALAGMEKKMADWQNNTEITTYEFRACFNAEVFESLEKVAKIQDSKVNSENKENFEEMCILIQHFDEHETNEKRKDIQLFVKKNDNGVIMIDTYDDATILDVKGKILAKTRVPVKMQRLVYGVRLLQDHYKLKDFNIRTESTLLLQRDKN